MKNSLSQKAAIGRIYSVVYIYPVEPNLCDYITVTDSILGEYMDDAKTSIELISCF